MTRGFELAVDMKDLKLWIEHEDSIYGTSISEVQKRMLEAFAPLAPPSKAWLAVDAELVQSAWR